jgi:hypothetical protein
MIVADETSAVVESAAHIHLNVHVFHKSRLMPNPGQMK